MGITKSKKSSLKKKKVKSKKSKLKKKLALPKKRLTDKDAIKILLNRNKELQKEINQTKKSLQKLEKESLVLTKLLIEKGYNH
ncbi:MAG: hypothetical protein GW938_14200 [Leptospira sp.]|nr:hypothetical protein [Leptospira sp.]NCS94292.1 hypothetical protein [Leptospira sp.]